MKDMRMILLCRISLTLELAVRLGTFKISFLVLNLLRDME